MARIGIVGLIGSGKSTVAAWFREWGATIIDGDALGWDVLKEPGIASALGDAFGAGILTSNGLVDRSALGAIVFRDPASMARLDSIVQPRLLELVRKSLATASATPLVLDAAMLTTWGLEPELDGVVQVVAPEAERAARLLLAKGFTAEESGARVRGQRLPEPRGSKLHWIIRNDGDLSALRSRAEAVWQEITALS